MATIGQPLTAPESGFTRYLFTDSNFEYSSGWTNNGSADKVSQTLGDTIKFNFYGDSIYILSYAWSNGGTMSVTIDGEYKGDYSAYSTSDRNYNVAFVLTDLDNLWHDVIIEVKKTRGSLLGVDVKGTIAKYDTSYTNKKLRMTLKNPTTNQHYSLADKTLILLPDGLDETIIEHGLEASKEIKLDEDFDKVSYVIKDKEVLGIGVIFKSGIISSQLKGLEVE